VLFEHFKNLFLFLRSFVFFFKGMDLIYILCEFENGDELDFMSLSNLFSQPTRTLLPFLKVKRKPRKQLQVTNWLH